MTIRCDVVKMVKANSELLSAFHLLRKQLYLYKAAFATDEKVVSMTTPADMSKKELRSSGARRSRAFLRMERRGADSNSGVSSRIHQS